MTFQRLGPLDLALYRECMALFGREFDVPDFSKTPPSDEYATRLLAKQHFVLLAARDGDAVVGALAAYELEKFEQERSEFYIYDLAVADTHRRRGIATALIEALKPIARERGGWVIFVQADMEEEDWPARQLYNKLGVEERVLHFDIDVGNDQ